MINSATVIAIANKHIAAQPASLDGYRLNSSAPREIDAGWYFDYIVDCDLDITESERGKFAGAAGFLIHRDSGDVQDLAFGQLSEFNLVGE